MEDLVLKIRSYQFMNTLTTNYHHHLQQQSATIKQYYNNLLNQSHQLIEYFSQFIINLKRQNQLEYSTLNEDKIRIDQENIQLKVNMIYNSYKKVIQQLEHIISQMRQQLVNNDQQIDKLRLIVQKTENKMSDNFQQSLKNQQSITIASQQNIQNLIKHHQLTIQQINLQKNQEISQKLSKIQQMEKEIQRYIIENQVLANRVQQLMEHIQGRPNIGYSSQLMCSPRIVPNLRIKDNSQSASRSNLSSNYSGIKNLSYENSFQGEGEVLQQILNTQGKNSINFCGINTKQRLLRIYQGQENNVNSINTKQNGSETRKQHINIWTQQKQIQQFEAEEIQNQSNSHNIHDSLITDTEPQNTKIDPYYCFFIITVQNQKINCKNFQKASRLNLQKQWNIINQKKIPLHEWTPYIKARIRSLIKIKSVPNA